MTTSIAIWDWERDPVPDARVVVCRPGLYSTPVSIEAADPRTRMLAHVVHGGAMVLPFEAHLMPSFRLRRGIIPALYAERRADIAGVGALLAVNAERRALVLCPREELHVYSMLRQASECAGLATIDLVVIIPPPEARTCGVCGGRGARPSWQEDYPPEACGSCNGSGRVEPWPIHPTWVRSIVEQCREVGALVADLTSDALSALPEWLT